MVEPPQEGQERREAEEAEHLRHVEFSPEELAGIQDAIETHELILGDIDLMVEDEDQDIFPGPSEEGLVIINPNSTDADPNRPHWREAEWQQIARILAEGYGLEAQAILDARPGKQKVILADKEAATGTLQLGLLETSDEVGPGEVPYLPFIATRTEQQA